MYTVTSSEESNSFSTRKEAIAAARELSDSVGGRVQVEDERQRELLTYRSGALESYVYETRRRTSRPD